MNAVDDRILDIFKSVFQLACVDKKCSQANCENWDSLRHLDLIVELESEFDVEFEPEEIVEMKDFDAIKRMLELKGI